MIAQKIVHPNKIPMFTVTLGASLNETATQ
jgi:hypothetical protein